MLLDIDNAARSSWFFVSPRPRKSASAVNSKTRKANWIEAFQTGNSSKDEYFTWVFEF